MAGGSQVSLAEAVGTLGEDTGTDINVEHLAVPAGGVHGFD